MANILDHEFIKKIKTWLMPGTKPGAEEEEVYFLRREKVIVFIGAYIMAISLWFIVNLNGSFSIDLNIPVEPGNVPENMALTENLPEFVQVGLSGDGWQLMNLYGDPPTVILNIDNDEINLFEQVRQRLSYLQGVDIAKVQPLLLSVEMEPKESKKVPIKVNMDFDFQNRYGLVGEPVLTPDSVRVTGAASRIENITEWQIQDTLKISDIRDDINVTLPLNGMGGVIELSETEVNVSADVSEFTEGERTVYIRTR